MTAPNPQSRKDRVSHLKWVPLSKVKINPAAQRQYRPAHAEEYASAFDLEALGYPVVNERDGWYWAIDGQHRIEALRLMGWGDQSIEMECYSGLTEEEEAELFLLRNNRRAVTAFDRFIIGVHAGRPAETDIFRVVQGVGLRVALDNDAKSVGAVSTLLKVYKGGGAVILARTLKNLSNAFPGDFNALRQEFVGGMGYVCIRYEGTLDDSTVVAQLAALPGSTNNLRQRAVGHRLKTGRPMSECMAASIVEVTKTGKGGKRLQSWWH